MPELRLGGELFGPLRLSEDLVQAPIPVRDGVIVVPTGPGLGVEVDEDSIAFLVRQQDRPTARAGTAE